MTHSESQRVEDQTDPKESATHCHEQGISHHMISIKTSSPMVPWIERCDECGWIDSRALEQSGHSIIKRSLSERAARVAVAIESEPFAFVQSSQEEPDLEEILLQAMAAASTRAAELGATGHASDGKRETAIYKALVREVARFQRLALEDAATRAVEAVLELVDGHFSDESLIKIRRAVEGTSS